MDLNTLTEKAQQAVVAAQTLATSMNHAEATPEHLLVALLEQRGGIVPSVLGKLKIEATQVAGDRSEEHTSELQSQSNLVCRLLLEKKKHPTSRSHVTT